MVPTTSNGAVFLLFVAVLVTATLLLLVLASFLLGVAPVLLRVFTPLGDEEEDGTTSFFAIVIDVMTVRGNLQ